MSMVDDAFMETRFWPRVEGRDDKLGCWIFRPMNPGETFRSRYAWISVKGKSLLVHRIAYEQLVGPIPEGMTIDHLCRNHFCVNPAHLEAVSNRTNVLRGVGLTATNARRTTCVHGHPFDEKNTYTHEWWDRGRRARARQCIACTREYTREWKKRKALSRRQAPTEGGQLVV